MLVDRYVREHDSKELNKVLEFLNFITIFNVSIFIIVYKEFLSMNIMIGHKIRGKYPDFGDANADAELNLSEKLNGKETDFANIYEHLKKFVIDNDIYKEKNNCLYLIAPNSVTVSVSFILTKFGLHFDFYPKPTNSIHWRYTATDEKNIQKIKNFITNDNKTNKDICIKLIGKFDISGEQSVYLGEGTIYTTQLCGTDKGKELNITHILKLPTIYDSLTNKNSCDLFKKNINTILESLNDNSITRIHVLSSIPTYGLIYLGQAMSKEICRDMEFILYNAFEDKTNKYIYKAGTILSTERFQQLEKEYKNDK